MASEHNIFLILLSSFCDRVDESMSNEGRTKLVASFLDPIIETLREAEKFL
jgi:hypothetical protein